MPKKIPRVVTKIRLVQTQRQYDGGETLLQDMMGWRWRSAERTLDYIQKKRMKLPTKWRGRPVHRIYFPETEFTAARADYITCASYQGDGHWSFNTYPSDGSMGQEDFIAILERSH